jgi:hypothetical protein
MGFTISLMSAVCIQPIAAAMRSRSTFCGSVVAGSVESSGPSDEHAEAINVTAQHASVIHLRRPTPRP